MRRIALGLLALTLFGGGIVRLLRPRRWSRPWTWARPQQRQYRSSRNSLLFRRDQGPVLKPGRLR
jgi:hypothetical protein